MSNELREFGLFLDGLRLERNISREDLCEGIMSLSQYKRYLRGDTSVPNGKLVMIADRLKFSISDIHFLFNKNHNNEYNKILRIYDLIKEEQFTPAYSLAQDMMNEVIVSEYNKLFFDFCFITIQHSLKLVSDIHVLDLFSNLIDYPNCANNEQYNMIEISILIKISNISVQINNYESSDMLYRILTSPNFQYSSANDNSFLPSIYSSLAKILGIKKEYDKVLEISNLGIKYCLVHETSNALSHLLFFNALANFHIGNKEEALSSAKKCFMQLHIENKPEKFRNFQYSFERNFNMKLEKLIKFK